MVWDSGFRVYSVGLRVDGLGFRVWDLICKVVFVVHIVKVGPLKP